MRTLFVGVLLLALAANKGYVQTPTKLIPTKDLECMMANNYHEARGESQKGMLAVSSVVINRLKSKKWANSVCDVIFQKKQFSWTSRRKLRPPAGVPREQARLVALDVLLAAPELPHDPTLGATWYHSVRIRKPPWTRKLVVTVVIGNHIFYKERS